MTDEERYDRWWRWNGAWQAPPRLLLFDHRWPRPISDEDLAPYEARYGWKMSARNVARGYATVATIQAFFGFPSDEFLARDPLRPVESDDCFFETDDGTVMCTGACRAYEVAA